MFEFSCHADIMIWRTKRLDRDIAWRTETSTVNVRSSYVKRMLLLW